MKFKKGLLAIILSIVTLFSVVGMSGCASDVGMDDGVLKIGYTLYPPMNYVDEANNFVGFDTELAEAVCEYLNLKVEFVLIDWDYKVMSLDSKEIDCIWNGMTITEELQEAILITEPYLENRQVIVCQASEVSKYTDQASLLTAKEVIVEAGSAGENTAEKLGVSQQALIKAGAQKDTLLEVKSSKDKVAVIDILMAQVLVGEGSVNEDLAYVDVNFELEQFGIGFRKDDVKTMTAVQEALNALKTDGTFAALQAKYFG
ncbi:MAG: transporter substrate-binding domain-containing protein [Clostridia bacterium]|nr:transporter substrate-binding domain-containing protein [Clostridia bacterium]